MSASMATTNYAADEEADDCWDDMIFVVAMLAALGTLVVYFVSTQYYEWKHQVEAPSSPSGIAVDPATVDEGYTSTGRENDPMHIVRVQAHSTKHRHSHANKHFDALPTCHHGHDHEDEDKQGSSSHVRQVVVSQNLCAIRLLVAALSLHQFFEGFALGGCISQVQFKKAATTMMAGFFAAMTPLGS
ncbi:hypothetical protein ZIOFF_003461 [Zingiber officinale]|uniref:Uncharacterized protein n=1 Tax=Zingiber officinale TaxID=94328 RepID=A0A8J5HXQ5_ZINOF|nr:hypothetical protein ZIOFF_003461 [Zingiber officinale]